MSNPDYSNLTMLLEQARSGDEAARQKVYHAIYDYLSEMARSQRFRYRPTQSLRTAELVHEAYLKLHRLQKDAWVDRSHFFAVAATAMRQIVLNHARLSQTQKRGNNAEHVPFEEDLLVDASISTEIISLNDALKKLEQKDARMAQVVECRFFAGYTVTQTAETLSISATTVKRDYKNAIIWLYSELDEPPSFS